MYSGSFIFLGLGSITILFGGSLCQTNCQCMVWFLQVCIAMQDDYISTTIEMNRRTGIFCQIAITSSLRASAKIQVLIEPQTIDRSHMRAAISADATDPIVHRLRHAIGHMRPWEQSLIVFWNAILGDRKSV